MVDATTTGGTRATVSVRMRMAWLSVVVGIGLLLLKSFAAWLTGSKAILSDAVESIVNVVASVVMLASVRLAEAPHDENHPFGHGKVEALTSGLEGALLLAAAAGIAWVSVPALWNPPTTGQLGWGLVITIVATLVNYVVGGILIRVGKREGSLALAADGKHLVSDAASSGALVVGVAAVWISDLRWLDPAIACVMAVWVLWMGIQVLRDAVRSLMNEARPDEIERVARALERDPIPGVTDPHDLRVLDAGTERFIELHVCVPHVWSVVRGHEVTAIIAERLRRAFAVPVTPIVQVEPCVLGLCPHCRDVCLGESAAPPRIDTIDRSRLAAGTRRNQGSRGSESS